MQLPPRVRVVLTSFVMALALIVSLAVESLGTETPTG